MKVGLALSGGGSRAIAFHLGCLRALHERGVLEKISVISAVSGGSIAAGMYAFSTDKFEEFDDRASPRPYLLRGTRSGTKLNELLRIIIMNAKCDQTLAIQFSAK